jgi:hypothetical protein
MNEKTILDRLHARAQGWLSRSECAELERELAADPVLLALAEDYALVHAVTAIDPASERASHTSFEELEPRLDAQPAWRRAAAAALLLAVGAGAGYVAGQLGRGEESPAKSVAESSPEPLYLQAIELESPASNVAAHFDVPARWSAYEPRGPLGVSFLSSVEEGEQLARLAERPLLVYGFYPGCPMAAALDAKVFTDPDVIELAERTVPVRLDLSQLPPAEQRVLTARGYPFLEVWRADGTPAHSLARNPDPTVFVESLHDGLERSDATGDQPPWEELHTLAWRLLEARESERAGRMLEAERAYAALLQDGRAPALAERAAAGLRRISDEARARLLTACAAAGRDPAEAGRELALAAERFAGTRFEPDLRAAQERLARDGRFPALAMAPRAR